MWIKEKNEDLKTIAYWCSCCKIPVIRPKTENEKCPICGHRMKFLSNTLRPVFPAEERLVEILTGQKFTDEILWKGKSTYYVNGKSLRITNHQKIYADDKLLRKELLNKNLFRLPCSNRTPRWCIRQLRHSYRLLSSYRTRCNGE